MELPPNLNDALLEPEAPPTAEPKRNSKDEMISKIIQVCSAFYFLTSIFYGASP